MNGEHRDTCGARATASGQSLRNLRENRIVFVFSLILTQFEPPLIWHFSHVGNIFHYLFSSLHAACALNANGENRYGSAVYTHTHLAGKFGKFTCAKPWILLFVRFEIEWELHSTAEESLREKCNGTLKTVKILSIFYVARTSNRIFAADNATVGHIRFIFFCSLCLSHLNVLWVCVFFLFSRVIMSLLLN